MTIKTLLVVNFVHAGSANCNQVIVRAWDTFLCNSRKKLLCDVAFLGKQYAEDELAHLAPHCKNIWVDPDPPGGYLNYPSFINARGYDYVIRVHHDAFPSCDTINNICNYLKSNPDTDLIMPTNQLKGISNIYHPMAMKICQEPIPGIDRVVPGMKPWGLPGHNADLFAAKRSFFLKCCSNYDNDKRIKRSIPYLTSDLTYGEVCDLLKFKDNRITQEVRESRIEGAADFHTHLCAMKPTVVGIVSAEGRSFALKNFLRNVGIAMKYGSYDKVRDSVDISFPISRTVYADHIPHIQYGYGMLAYVTELPINKIKPIFPGLIQMLTPPARLSYYLYHYAITKLLILTHGSRELKERFNKTMNILFDYLGTDKVGISELVNPVIEFYKPAIAEYLI